MKKTIIKHPRMVQSSAFKARLLDPKLEEMANGGKVESQGFIESIEKAAKSAGDAVKKAVGAEDRKQEDISTQRFLKTKDNTPGYAEGGKVNDEEIEEAVSLAESIIKRRKMANGGEIASHDAIYSDDSDTVDLSRNADEDANEEDQLSYNALRKENYDETNALDAIDPPTDSNMEGQEPDDQHDLSLVEAIRRKMKSRS